MAETNDTINQLLARLDILTKKQEDFSKEINAIREELYKIRSLQTPTPFLEKNQELANQEVINIAEEAQKAVAQPSFGYKSQFVPPQKVVEKKKESFFSEELKSNFEKFIGENLISKIGILILVIGVAIGAQYSFEHDLISPLTRIILGYAVGLALLGFGIYLKKSYLNYSAVLVSGAIAILYFITFAAYSLYELIPQELTFGLMVVFTAFTVVTAIHYNKQVIAHIGLVGAYAIPFMLSNGSGQIVILFTYIAIINIGILIIAFQKYWKQLYYSSFAFTWLIYSGWYGLSYVHDDYFTLALVFLGINFVTFYSIFLSYKLIRKEQLEIFDVVLLLANSFVFYGFGYAILYTDSIGEQLLGLFTLANALIHFIVSTVIYKQKLADKNLFYLVAGLVLVFITITVPVQLDGNWVTLLWAFEAALLYWFGKTKNAPVFEILSYPLIYLAFFSLLHDWSTDYGIYLKDQPETRITVLFNIQFLTNLLFSLAFGCIIYIQQFKRYDSIPFGQKELQTIMQIVVPVMFFVVFFNTFWIEISTYWSQLYTDSALEIRVKGQEYPDNFWNADLLKFESIWLINYALLFFSLLSFLNFIKLKNRYLAYANLIFSLIALLVFLGQSLLTLSELRESYISQNLAEYYQIGVYNLVIRYISLGFVALLIYTLYLYKDQEFIKPTPFNFDLGFEIIFYVAVLWIASSELIAWMDLLAFDQSYKLGLSILWGIYALVLIVIGIWKNKKHIRIGAIAFFGITLLKLFFYDISDLDTIAKTIVFVSLGILLLTISFLYNKFKQRISPENET